MLLIPHYVVLVVLAIVAVVAIILAWFAILASGRYPRPLFDYVVGVNRYALRVTAYGLMLDHRPLPARSASPHSCVGEGC